jgi:UDP-hydrolysing UDP-N-acetyl-D-glucosamine 2-epimerase
MWLHNHLYKKIIMSKRKVAVVVTARPTYSRIKTALKAIDQHAELELQLVVAGSALLNRYGSIIDYIEADGFKISERIYNVLEGENPTSMAKTTGLGIMELATAFQNLEPDVVVTVADRFETISTAIAASFMNIPLVHVQGGEVTGNIDEKVRHAITKLADTHFVANEDARERVIKMGEVAEKVYVTGCPSIDLAAEVSNAKKEFNPFEKYSGVGNLFDFSNGYLVVMQHPVTTEYQEAKNQVTQLLEIVHELDYPTFWFWPNVDAGSDGTSNGIRTYREFNTLPNIHFFKNMEGMDFLQLIKQSKCLVGNSSVGIREASYLGVPVVNIGKRQNRRLRGENVVDVNHDAAQIKKAILDQIKISKYDSELLYGDGKAGETIADLLVKIDLSIEKVIQY